MTAQFACADIRLRLLDYQRGTLVAGSTTPSEPIWTRARPAHTRMWPRRRSTHVLERRLPQHPAPIALKRRLGARGRLPRSRLLPAGAAGGSGRG